MDHVTCLHSSSLIQMSDGDDRSGISRRSCRDLLSAAKPPCSGMGLEPRLLASQGSSYLDNSESLVAWNGFTNLYDGYSVFWRMDTCQPSTSQVVDSILLSGVRCGKVAPIAKTQIQ